MMPRKIRLETAQALAIMRQGLHRRSPSSDQTAMMDVIRQIGLLQLDTINIVARTHYLVMLSRLGLYDRAELDGLLYPHRLLFEGWAHAACLIPAEHYDYFAPGIQARREAPLRPREVEALGADFQKVVDHVLAQIKDRGPLCSRDFEDPRNDRGSWWSYKPAKHALVMLYERGHLMVDRRVNFQLYYDLAERVLPASANGSAKTMTDYQHWATVQGLACLGVATAPQISDYYRLKVSVVRPILKQLMADGELLPVELADWKETGYIRRADLPLIEQLEDGRYRPEVTTFLSPFDNLTWNRNRLKALFGFDYRIEIYTPAAKRKYGYYVLPILHNGRFVGRIDPKADRKNRTLIIRHLFLEPDVPVKEELVIGIALALREFMSFHGSENIRIEHSEPATLAAAVLGAVCN